MDIKWHCGFAERAPPEIIERLSQMVPIEPLVIEDAEGTSHLYLVTCIDDPAA